MTARQRFIWAVLFFGLSLGILAAAEPETAGNMIIIAGIAFLAGAWHLIRLFGW